ncbi:MAG: sigma 54-interacting transcriptional regulator, partial [Firmicutes bacterium]|nr:sigma 54-interacting transcriptional regulator [Bacillota bacterium]
MLSIGSLLIDSLDYIMIVDRDYNIIYNTRYDMTLGGDGRAYVSQKYFEMYPKLKREESSIVRCIETGEVIIRKNQRYEDYLGNVYLTNNVTLPLKKKGEFIAAVEMAMDADPQDKDKKLVESRFDEFVKRVKEAAGKITFDTILTEDPEMKRNIEKAKVLATMPNPTLIYGETGTGKEVFAQAMINYSGVSKNNVVIQNCA